MVTGTLSRSVSSSGKYFLQRWSPEKAVLHSAASLCLPPWHISNNTKKKDGCLNKMEVGSGVAEREREGWGTLNKCQDQVHYLGWQMLRLVCRCGETITRSAAWTYKLYNCTVVCNIYISSSVVWNMNILPTFNAFVHIVEILYLSKQKGAPARGGQGDSWSHTHHAIMLSARG